MNRPVSTLRSEVLIVDRSAESREVFRTILAQRGLMTLETASIGDGLELARRYRPRVVVLDLDDDAWHDDASTFVEYRQQCESQDSALLVLGVARGTAGLDNDQVVAKPYHYGPLIRKIEQLCRQSLETDNRLSAVAG